MPPIRSIKNQYPGINAHLHSFWQASRTWHRFHNVHITYLLADLRRLLLPMGYTADIEESLQIRRSSGEIALTPKSDIAIYDPRPPSFEAPEAPAVAAQAAFTTAEFLEVADREHPYYAIAIRPFVPGDPEQGDPVAWIELLSPSNKGRSKDGRLYTDKRLDIVESGIVFIELDYLHETPPTSGLLADYTEKDASAHAYRIVVIDPRPSMTFGLTKPVEFDVDAAIPAVAVPLNEGDMLAFDFNASYQTTFESVQYGYDLSYAQLPMNFDRYSPADQARIANRMLAVIRAARAGVDLEASAPLTIPDPLPLDDALAQIKALTAEGA